MEKFKRSSGQSGQTIIETVVGIIFLIPIVLFLFDISVLVLANTANDNLAKTVARAAASAIDAASKEGTAQAAYSAAENAASRFAASALISKTDSGSFLTGFNWNGTGSQDNQGSSWKGENPEIGDVGVVTSIRVTVPVPFPFLPKSVDFDARAVEPIVSIAANTAPTIKPGPGSGGGQQNAAGGNPGGGGEDPTF